MKISVTMGDCHEVEKLAGCWWHTMTLAVAMAMALAVTVAIAVTVAGCTEDLNSQLLVAHCGHEGVCDCGHDRGHGSLP